MRMMLATDGSANAAIAATLVENTRWPLGTSIDVVRVLEDAGRSGVRDAEESLLGIAARLRNRDLSTAHALLNGRPAGALLDWIDRHRPDLVVVGRVGIPS